MDEGTKKKLEELKESSLEKQKLLGKKLKLYLYEKKEEIKEVIDYIDEEGLYDLLPFFVDGMLLRVIENEKQKTICILEMLVYLEEKMEIEKQTTYKEQFIPYLIEFYLKELARCKKGIVTLLKEKHSFTLKNLEKFLNNSFYNSLHEQNSFFLEELITYGYQKNVMEHMGDLDEFTLNNFLKNNELQKEYLLKSAFQKWNKNRTFFLDLPENKKHFISLYRVEYYQNIFHKNLTSRLEYEKELQKIYKSNFDGIWSEELQNKIIAFYGKMKDHTLEFIIRETIKDKERFWKKVENLSTKYFENDSLKTIEFLEKHPFLRNPNKKEEEIVERIEYLKENKTVTYSDSSLTFLTEGIDGVTPKFVSPTCFEKLEEPIFSYEREVAILNEYGVLEEEEAFSHEECIRNRYPGFLDDVVAASYYGNSLGDVIFVIENKAMIIWFPWVLSKLRKTKILSLIENLEQKSISNKINIACAYAIPDRWKEYISLNNGMYMDLKKLKKTIDYFQVIEEKRVLKKD